ncbi:ArnT family glycosyltransferase [Kineococcus sp. SYSU DK006]|uniref:ArnT family glycosyltransferase n=1 Tax=Kineococcus sp. SYSU DK006 TaxID=3383127 RepID=UPI003D7E98B4
MSHSVTSRNTDADRPAGRYRATTAGRFSRVDAALLAIVVGATLGIRLPGIWTAYDIYVDEFVYVLQGQSVRDGHIPPGTPDQPFLIHPPGFFVYEALWMDVFGVDADRFDAVFAMREAQQVLVALTAVGLYLVVRSLVGRVPALITGLVFALDPFVVRQNGRILLESSTMTWAVLGFAVLVPLVRHFDTAATDAGPPARTARRHVVAAAGGGLLFGCAIASKDMAAFTTAFPLAVGLLTGWFLPRKLSAVALAAACVPYAVFVGFVASAGLLPELWRAKTSGLSRLAGATITTGYNADDAPSITSVALQQIHDFGTSYAVMAAGGAAALWLLVRTRRQAERFVALAAVLGCAMVGYGVLFGTSEEHLFYFVVVPVLAPLSVVAVGLFRRARQRDGRAPIAVVGALLAATLVFDAVAWARLRSTPDDGQVQAYEWLMRNAPAGANVVWIAGQTKYMFRGTDHPTIDLEDPARMAAEAPFYMLILEKEVEQRYSYASPEDVQWYTSRSDLVFSQRGATYGEVSVYRVHDPSTW